MIVTRTKESSRNAKYNKHAQVPPPNSRPTSSGPKQPPEPPAEKVKATLLPDDALDDIIEQLKAICEDMSVDLPDLHNFYVRVRGGEWTKKHKGVVVDCIHVLGLKAV